MQIRGLFEVHVFDALLWFVSFQVYFVGGALLFCSMDVAAAAAANSVIVVEVSANVASNANDPYMLTSY